MDTCGKRIKFLRTEKGLTLDQLAEKAGISKGFLWEVENDRTDIGGERLLRVANALSASLDFILRGDNKPRDYKPPNLELPDELVRLADQEHLSFRETRVLLEIERSVYAKRSTKTRQPLTKDEWKKLYDGVKSFLKEKPDEKS